MNRIKIKSSIIALALCAGLTSVATAAETGFLFSANAYGTKVNGSIAGVTIKSSPTAPSGIGAGCGTTKAPKHSENSVLSVNLAPTLFTGVIFTSADGLILTDGTQKATAMAETHGANVLAGLITADEVKAVSTITHDFTGFQTSAAGTTFVNLVVAGNLLGVSTAPNTRIELAGFGYVIINEQIAKTTTKGKSLTVNGLHVVITRANILNLKVGTNIIVSHAFSTLSGPDISGTLDGFAYGSKANVANIITSGKTAPVSVGCLGTNGVVKTASVLSVTIPGLASTGTVTDTAVGTVNGTSATVETTSTVEAVKVLTDLVTADLVKADAHASKVNGVVTLSDSGSSFVNLHVKGFPAIDDNVAPDTQLTIAGLGTLYLHRVLKTQTDIEVRMIELIITQQNTLGLEIGTVVQIAVAHASAH